MPALDHANVNSDHLRACVSHRYWLNVFWCTEQLLVWTVVLVVLYCTFHSIVRLLSVFPYYGNIEIWICNQWFFQYVRWKHVSRTFYSMYHKCPKLTRYQRLTETNYPTQPWGVWWPDIQWVTSPTETHERRTLSKGCWDDTDSAILNICSAIEVDPPVQPSDIAVSHRLGKRRPGKRDRSL